MRETAERYGRSETINMSDNSLYPLSSFLSISWIRSLPRLLFILPLLFSYTFFMLSFFPIFLFLRTRPRRKWNIIS